MLNVRRTGLAWISSWGNGQPENAEPRQPQLSVLLRKSAFPPMAKPVFSLALHLASSAFRKSRGLPQNLYQSLGRITALTVSSIAAGASPGTGRRDAANED